MQRCCKKAKDADAPQVSLQLSGEAVVLVLSIAGTQIAGEVLVPDMIKQGIAVETALATAAAHRVSCLHVGLQLGLLIGVQLQGEASVGLQ